LLLFLTQKIIKKLSSMPGNNIPIKTNISEKWNKDHKNITKPEHLKYASRNG
jgi:hypothetical protein